MIDRSRIELFSAVIDNEITFATELILTEKLFSATQDEIKVIDLSKEFKTIVNKTFGNISKETYLISGFLRKVEKKLDGRLSQSVHDGLVAMDDILSGHFDYNDIVKVIDTIVFVQENEAQFYN